MQEHEKVDGRDQRDGGWSWVQNDLYTFFLPIIGREAAHLYQVLAYLIPARAKDPVFDLSLRVIEKVAKMGKSTIQRELVTLHKVGMVVRQSQGPGQPAVYLLGDLRKLAKLGDAEMRRRLGVPEGDSGGEGGGSGSPSDATPADAQRRATGDDAQDERREVPAAAAGDSEGSGGAGVPPGDSGEVAPESVEKPDFSTLSELLLSQKPGGTVPETPGDCPTDGAPLILNLSRNLNTPLPPASGGGVLDSISASVVLEDEVQEQKLPSEGEGQGRNDAEALRAAVAKVMREANFSDPRLEPVIERAMRVEASKTDDAPNWNGIAEHMCEARAEYSRLSRDGCLRFGPYRMDKFFAGGIWIDSGLWGIDHQRTRRL